MTRRYPIRVNIIWTCPDSSLGLGSVEPSGPVKTTRHVCVCDPDAPSGAWLTFSRSRGCTVNRAAVDIDPCESAVRQLFSSLLSQPNTSVIISTNASFRNTQSSLLIYNCWRAQHAALKCCQNLRISKSNEIPQCVTGLESQEFLTDSLVRCGV